MCVHEPVARTTAHATLAHESERSRGGVDPVPHGYKRHTPKEHGTPTMRAKQRAPEGALLVCCHDLSTAGRSPRRKTCWPAGRQIFST